MSNEQRAERVGGVARSADHAEMLKGARAGWLMRAPTAVGPVATQPMPDLAYTDLAYGVTETHSWGRAWQRAQPRDGCKRGPRPWPGARRRAGARLVVSIYPPTSQSCPPPLSDHLQLSTTEDRFGDGRSRRRPAYAPRSSVRAAAAMPDWRRDLSIVAGFCGLEQERGDRRGRLPALNQAKTSEISVRSVQSRIENAAVWRACFSRAYHVVTKTWIPGGSDPRAAGIDHGLPPCIAMATGSRAAPFSAVASFLRRLSPTLTLTCIYITTEER